MKKQAQKLKLSKKTISNLDAIQMKNLVGGHATHGAGCDSNQCTHKCYPSEHQCLTVTCRASGCPGCF